MLLVLERCNTRLEIGHSRPPRVVPDAASEWIATNRVTSRDADEAVAPAPHNRRDPTWRTCAGKDRSKLLSFIDMSSKVYEPIANHAISVYPRLNAPGFESSKVFALTALYLASPPPGFPSQRALGKHLSSLYLFVLHPNKRAGKNGDFPDAPEVFYINVTKNKTEVGRGAASKFSKRLLQGRTRNVVVVECCACFNTDL